MTPEEYEEKERERKEKEQAGGSYHGDVWVPNNTSGTAGSVPAGATSVTKTFKSAAPPPVNPAQPIGDSSFFDPNKAGSGTNAGYVNPNAAPGTPTNFVPGPDGMGVVGTSPVTPLGGSTDRPATNLPAPPPSITTTINQAPLPAGSPPVNPLATEGRKTEVPNVTTTTVTPVKVNKESAFEKIQREAAEEIQKVLRGETPSLAALQAKEAQDRALAQQRAIAAGARGKSLASAQRTLATNTGTLQMQGAAEAAKLRAQEIAQARGELASLATAGRGQDQDMAKFEAGLDVDIQKFNAQALNNASATDVENYLKGIGLDDTYIKGVRDQWLAFTQLGMTDQIERLKIDMSYRIAELAKTKDGWDKISQILGPLGGLGEGVGAVVAASDPRVKMKIVKLEGPHLDEFLKATQSAFSWNYKDPDKHGHGRHEGPMATDIIKSRLGRTAVFPDEEGVLNLDMRRLAALALMGLGRLDKRLSDVEGKK